MGLYLGIARARLGPAAAVIDGTRGLVAACEENRLTRARQAPTSGPPELAIAELLAFVRGNRADISATGVVRDEDAGSWATPASAVDIDPHQAHAEYAFRASPFQSALAVVCDATAPQGWTAWRATNGGGPSRGAASKVLDNLGQFPLAQIYGELTQALGFERMRDEHLVESMARAGRESATGIADLIACSSAGVSLAPGFGEAVRAAIDASRDRERTKRDIAASVQRRLGGCLVELLQRLAAPGTITPRPAHLCLSGGLFFNTHFTTIAAASGAFARTFIAPHPGRNGAAVGAAVRAGAPVVAGAVGSAYLGPEYGFEQIKEALDNCKLSYDLLRTEKLYETVIHAISRGRLVGWFHGRLEWGPRALGHRSVVADPFAPHVLDNLNGFLKRRPAYRSYGVSVPLTRLTDYFEVPAQPSDAPTGLHESPFMQYEFRPRDPEKFRTILPAGVETIRVHTVDQHEPRFLRLLELWGEKSGVPILVNTSFNGFHEPLVCSPRDAIRVFYGTGLDVLALEDFVLRK